MSKMNSYYTVWKSIKIDLIKIIMMDKTHKGVSTLEKTYINDYCLNK